MLEHDTERSSPIIKTDNTPIYDDSMRVWAIAINIYLTAKMAEDPPLSKQELLASKLAQEIAKKGDEIPEKYLSKDCFPEAIEAPDLWKHDLLIDCSLLTSSSAAPELAKLRSALSQWGCFQV